MSACERCGLAVCACRTGKTRVTAAGATAADARIVADGYLERRGWRGDVLRVRKRRTRLGVMGYQAWELEYMVERR